MEFPKPFFINKFKLFEVTGRGQVIAISLRENNLKFEDLYGGVIIYCIDGIEEPKGYVVTGIEYKRLNGFIGDRVGLIVKQIT